jgi:sugar phosphate isomerase/epimerase
MSQGNRSRRELLLAGAAGAVVTAFNSSARGDKVAEQANPNSSAAMRGDGSPLPAVLRSSIAAYSFREYLDTAGKPGKMSLFDLTDMAARWGLDAIEPTSYYFLKTDDEYLVALKRKVFLAGLEISGTPTNNNFALPAGPELEKSKARIREWVDHAVVLGSPVIRVFAGNARGAPSREESLRFIVEAFKDVSQYAGKHGVFLALENHGFMTETADDVLRIVDAVGSDWLSVNLDTGNFRDKPYEQIAKLAPRAVACQIKGKVHDAGKEMEPDMQRIVGILREAKYRGYVALEYEGRDPHKNVPVYLEKIQAAMQATA